MKICKTCAFWGPPDPEHKNWGPCAKSPSVATVQIDDRSKTRNIMRLTPDGASCSLWEAME